MTALSHTSNATVAPNSRDMSLAWIFTGTIFLSALLLFSVQPMFTKIVLPLLGGSSNVWNTAMVFFQAMLLGGYIYAHLVTTYLPIKAQVLMHAGVTAFGFIFLPLGLASGIVVPESDMPTLWLLGLFGATVGAPFFALSANAPLLQRWFSLTDHKDAQDPYFLYAASNLASLLILCAYPVFIEPNLPVGGQSKLWAIGYVALFMAILVTGWRGLTRLAPRAPAETADTTHREALTLRTVGFWILLAFIPSSLMLGVTSYITNNIASAPFIWIVPLALYLLTFVIVFAKTPIVTTRRMAWMFPWVALAAYLVMEFPLLSAMQRILGGLVIFFLIALFCHARLAEARPDVSRLTTFYILMSLGGVLGGIFNALIAPVIFVGVYEYVIVLFVAAFVLPSSLSLKAIPNRAILVAVLGFLAMPLIYWGAVSLGISVMFAVATAGLVFYIALLPLGLPLRYRAFILATIVAVSIFQRVTDAKVIHMDRSFYSTLEVWAIETETGPVHAFVHGNTIHNRQMRAPGLESIPVAYYSEGGTIHTAVDSARRVSPTPNVAVIGLGAGAMACHEKPGEQWTYFEIDSKVVDMARDPALFSYLDTCAPSADIRIGDARQRIMSLPEASQDLIVVDAFSSDTIPVHLMTREAMAIYKSRLKPTGLIFFHTTNRLLDVTSVATVMAADAGWDSRFIHRMPDPERPHADAALKAIGVLAGPAESLLTATRPEAAFVERTPSTLIEPWTDDYASIWQAFRAGKTMDAKNAQTQ